MPVQIEPLVNEIGERAIARKTRPIDMQAETASLDPQPIADYADWRRRMGRYYAHVMEVVLDGGRLPEIQAEGRALRAIEREYRDRGGDLNSAFQDAVDGTNEGEIGQRKLIKDDIKREVAEYHVLAAFDRYVNPSSWEEKVACIRAFLARYGDGLRDDINPNQPERYAQDYRELIRSYVRALQRASAGFRRL